jgi:hypothetical protein
MRLRSGRARRTSGFAVAGLLLATACQPTDDPGQTWAAAEIGALRERAGDERIWPEMPGASEVDRVTIAGSGHTYLVHLSVDIGDGLTESVQVCVAHTSEAVDAFCGLQASPGNEGFVEIVTSGETVFAQELLGERLKGRPLALTSEFDERAFGGAIVCAGAAGSAFDIQSAGVCEELPSVEA